MSTFQPLYWLRSPFSPLRVSLSLASQGLWRASFLFLALCLRSHSKKPVPEPPVDLSVNAWEEDDYFDPEDDAYSMWLDDPRVVEACRHHLIRCNSLDPHKYPQS